MNGMNMCRGELPSFDNPSLEHGNKILLLLKKRNVGNDIPLYH